MIPVNSPSPKKREVVNIQWPKIKPEIVDDKSGYSADKFESDSAEENKTPQELKKFVLSMGKVDEPDVDRLL